MPFAAFNRSFRAAVAAACVVASLGLAAPATAQSADAEALGAEVAHHMMAAADFKGFHVLELTRPEIARGIEGLVLRPGWEAPLREAVAEEIDHDLPALERLIGREFAAAFTLRELQALTDFLKGPGGQAMLAAMAADFAGQTPPAPSAPALQEISRFMNSPEGAAFRAKFQDLDTRRFDNLVDEELIPGVIQRYETKIAARPKSD